MAGRLIALATGKPEAEPRGSPAVTSNGQRQAERPQVSTTVGSSTIQWFDCPGPQDDGASKKHESIERHCVVRHAGHGWVLRLGVVPSASHGHNPKGGDNSSINSTTVRLHDDGLRVQSPNTGGWPQMTGRWFRS